MRASRYPYDHPHLIFPVSVRAPLRRETTRTAGHPGGAAVGEPGECKQAWAVVPGQQAGATQAQAVANLGVATEAPPSGSYGQCVESTPGVPSCPL